MSPIMSSAHVHFSATTATASAKRGSEDDLGRSFISTTIGARLYAFRVESDHKRQ